MTNDFSDSAILARELKRRNKKAFAHLYNIYYQDLCIYIYGYTKNAIKAEDIVQSTMIKIWENSKNINPKKPIKNYLYKIAYHQFINQYRKEKKHLNYCIELKREALFCFIDDTPETENKKSKLVLEAIENLPPMCKKVFLLNKKHGLKYREISEELNISIKTVEIHISKALKRVKEKLK